MKEDKQSKGTQKGNVLKISEADPHFKHELSKIHGGEKIMLCYRCGTCTASCPIGMRVDEFKPAKIVRLSAFGFKDLLLPGDMLWLCTGCYTCYERCPQEVRPSEVIAALRIMAVREGYMPPSFKALYEDIAKNGYIYEITEFLDEIRMDLGLPPAPKVNVDEVRKIMEKTGLVKLIGITLEKD
jgi:heterodisulfide reductase subunit C